MATITEPQTTEPDATKSPDRLFRYSEWVHIGALAEDCPHGEDGTCTSAEHFHAWCRLPNQLQHDDIRGRALAAKARRIRQLRDVETDAYEVLESDIAELRRGVDQEALVDELVGREWWKRHLEAMSEVEEDEKFQTIDRDRERLAELRAMDPEKRPSDEFDELERHVTAYNEQVDARRAELERPARQALEGLSFDELVDQVREERINAEASNAFMQTYSRWEWLSCTYTSNHPTERRRSFAGEAELADAAPEILDALRATFAELETSLQRGSQGN